MKKTTKSSKATNNTKAPKSSSSSLGANNAQKQLERELGKIGLSVDEASEWLNRDTSKTCGIEGCPTCDTDQFDELNDSAISNVSFVPGATAEETLIYVGDTLLKGVRKASLEYDAELGLPMLKLEILGISVE
jgi:hypothetical protein